MSSEKLLVEIPEFPDDPADGLLEDSRAHEVSPEPIQVSSALGRLIFERGTEVPQKTFEYDEHYDEYEAAGKEALSVAILTEQVYGLDAAVGYYKKASTNFIAAIGASSEIDPDMLIQYGDSLVKQVQSGQVDSYRPKEHPLSNPDSYHRDRSDDLQNSARKSYDLAWGMLLNDPSEAKNEDHLVRAAVIISEGLKILDNHGVAKAVLLEAKQKLIDDADTDPELISFIDDYAFTPDNKRLYTREDVLAEALLGLATEEPHEILQLV